MSQSVLQQHDQQHKFNDVSGIIGTSPKTKAKYQQLAQQLQVKVEEIEHPPFEIVDNTDDIEPKPANIIIKNEVTTIHNQIYIQSPQQTLNTKMPMIINQQQQQQQTPQQINPTNKQMNQQQQQQLRDQDMLTNSTLTGKSFLPKIYQQNINQQQQNNMQVDQKQKQQQQNNTIQNGYISDYYKQNNNKLQLSLKKARENNNKSDKNSNQYISDQSEKRSNNNGGYSSNNNNNNSNQQQVNQQSNQKLNDKKFFQSKIDFMAPIKSLQNRQAAIDPLQNHLSDDSSYYDQPFVSGLPQQLQQQQQQLRLNKHYNNGPPTIKGSDNDMFQQQQQQQYDQQINAHQRAESVSKRINNPDYHLSVINKYANLTQIQEETMRSTKSKNNNQSQYPKSLNNSIMTSNIPQQQQNNNTNRFNNNSYGIMSLNRNAIGTRKQSNNNMNGNYKKNNYSFIQNTQQINMSAVGNNGPRSTINNNKKFNNLSLDQGYNNSKMSPQLKLPNLKMAYKKETLISNNNHQSQHSRLCAVCAKKHNPNQPHIVQSVSNKQKQIIQKSGPLQLNKNLSRGGVINSQYNSRLGNILGLNNNNNNNQSKLSSSRSQTTSRNRIGGGMGSQSNRQLSLNNSQRSLLGSRTNNYNNNNANYNQIDKLRSVNKIRTIPRKDSQQSFGRNYKSLSPCTHNNNNVTMINRNQQSNNNQQLNNNSFQKHYQQQQTLNNKMNNNNNAMVLTPNKTIGKTSFGFSQPQQQQQQQPQQNMNTQQVDGDAELVCREKELDPSIEDEIKDGFFELRQKFKEQGRGESSIYVSHVVLHAKHPIFCKLEIDTLKQLLTDSSIIYLAKDQLLYKNGSQDNIVYFVLFGRLNLTVPPIQNQINEDIQNIQQNMKNDSIQYTNNQINFNTPQKINNILSSDQQSVNSINNNNQVSIGKANIGWTLGEEILYDKNMQIRQESCFALMESCLLGIQKSKLAIIQKALLDKGNQKDYFVIESVLKGNYLIKNNWRKEFQEYYTAKQSQKSRSSPGQSQIGQEDINNNNNVFLT